MSFELDQNLSSDLRVFITKDISATSLFRSKIIPKNWIVNGISLIEFTTTDYKQTTPTDWIFFSSKNAVKSFFELGYKINDRKLACIGKGTAGELQNHVKEIDFIGENVDINVTAQQFAEVVGKATCLFPISNISNRTVQKAFDDTSQAIDIIVYNTREKTEINIPESDVLIFTSPSNVRSYFSKNKIYSAKKIIAIGPSTGKELALHGVNDSLIPNATGETGLIDLIISLT